MRTDVDQAPAGAAVRRQRVLVVEDEPMVAEVVERYLRRDGYDVRVVHDGERALAEIRIRVFRVCKIVHECGRKRVAAGGERLADTVVQRLQLASSEVYCHFPAAELCSLDEEVIPQESTGALRERQVDHA